MLLRKYYREGKLRAHYISLIGMSFLAVGLVIGQFFKSWLLGDFIEGISVGLSIPLMMMGIYYGARSIRQNSVSVPE
jgi:uncharacterized membrane-anchored protein